MRRMEKRREQKVTLLILALGILKELLSLTNWLLEKLN